jgi:hypothetical protein
MCARRGLAGRPGEVGLGSISRLAARAELPDDVGRDDHESAAAADHPGRELAAGCQVVTVRAREAVGTAGDCNRDGRRPSVNVIEGWLSHAPTASRSGGGNRSATDAPTLRAIRTLRCGAGSRRPRSMRLRWLTETPVSPLTSANVQPRCSRHSLSAFTTPSAMSSLHVPRFPRNQGRWLWPQASRKCRGESTTLKALKTRSMRPTIDSTTRMR